MSEVPEEGYAIHCREDRIVGRDATRDERYAGLPPVIQYTVRHAGCQLECCPCPCHDGNRLERI